jgi:hypothetical protein
MIWLLNILVKESLTWKFWHYWEPCSYLYHNKWQRHLFQKGDIFPVALIPSGAGERHAFFTKNILLYHCFIRLGYSFTILLIFQMNSSKKDCCDVVKIGKKTYFRCTLCGAHRSTKNRVFSHLVDCHSLSKCNITVKVTWFFGQAMFCKVLSRKWTFLMEKCSAQEL